MTANAIFDYANQAWTENGKYVRCGHPASMNCQCYGRIHQGEPIATAPINAPVHSVWCSCPLCREWVERQAVRA